MNIKKIAAALVMVGGLATAAQASTDFTFGAAADGSYSCITYCTGFATTDPAHTVGAAGVTWNGATYRLMVQVDGVSYVGAVTAQQQVVQLTEQDIVNGIAVYGPSTLLASAQWTTKRTCTHSGRGQHCTTWYFPYSGTVSLP
jgi:hypothetical protein